MCFTDKFDEVHIQYQKNVPSSSLSAIRAGGILKTVVYPNNTEELIFSISCAVDYGMPYIILGNFTNTMFTDMGYDGVVICTNKISSFKVTSDKIIADAGISFGYLTRRLSDSGIYISLAMSGIPGSIGGMVKSNAGAYGECVSDVILDASFYSPDEKKTFNLSADSMDFSYRHSILCDTNYILLNAGFAKRRMNKTEILDKLMEYSRQRREKQPKEPSLGSFFKRPGDNEYASRLIDNAGLRGYSFGRAMVSSVHAGFIVNCGGSTATEIITLSEIVRETVYKKFGILLKREVEILGNI